MTDNGTLVTVRQSHHQPRFAFDDRCLALGLEVALRIISDYLSEDIRS